MVGTYIKKNGKDLSVFLKIVTHVVGLLAALLPVDGLALLLGQPLALLLVDGVAALLGHGFAVLAVLGLARALWHALAHLSRLLLQQLQKFQWHFLPCL